MNKFNYYTIGSIIGIIGFTLSYLSLCITLLMTHINYNFSDYYKMNMPLIAVCIMISSLGLLIICNKHKGE